MNWPRPLDDDPNLLRNKLATKESQLAAQQTDLLKRAEQLDELKNTLNETLHKLNQEVTNGVNLENILAKCRDDLQTEKLVSQNAVAARDAAQDKLKEKELDMRGLESNLESLSHTSNSTNARTLKLEKEKSILENRIRELEANLRQLSSPAPTATPARSRAPSRRRSSSVSDTRVITLEQDLKDTRASLAQKDADLRAASTKLAQTQTDLVRIENEKVVADKRLQAQIHDLQAALQEKEEELVYFQDQQGGSREEELLQRIDEDETKIAALERLLSEAPQTQVQVQRMEQQLLEASERIVDMEGRNIELVREKEEALDEIDDARAQITQLSDAVRERDAFIAKQREIPPRPSEEDVSRLLAAIDRIRGERDNLRRDVEFLQNEARFTEEALRSRIAALEQTAQSPQLQAEVLCLQEQLAKSTEHEQTILVQKNKEIRRVGRVAMASAVIIEHLRSQMGVTAQQFLNASTASEGACGRLREADLQFSATPLRRQQSGDLHTRQLMFDTSDGDNTQVRLVQLESQVEELSHTLDDITAERDALNLQTTNLARDLETAQRDIAEGETRYTELQFHQLSSMTVNAATEALRRQLADQEQRVLRRTELVGILQHDNQRIATNMKLQEERLMELTSELEVLAAQKEAMVEDCAEARHARDGAIGRVDELEVEMEAVERRAVDADGVIQTMVGVVMATVARSRRTLQRIQQAAEQTRQDLHSEIQHLNEQLALKDRLITENDLEGEIARLRVAHVEEMGDLQRRLVELTSAVEEAQARCDAAEENYRQALSDSTRSRREFENAAGDAEEHANSLNAELTRLRDQHAEVLRELRDQLASATADAQRAQADRDALDGVHQRVLKQLAEAREGSETRLQELDDRVAELDSQLEEQTSRCEALSEEVDALRDQVQGEMDLRAAEKTRLDTAVQNAIGQRERAESVLEDIRRELSAATEELALARSEIHAAEGEKTELQEEVTLLQAEKQRSLSLHRYLESQVKEKAVDRRLDCRD
ncbi:hypothetical protein C8F01DRAFT_396916 [Mycena amicta]|nr:hypothetical protein C8F01DRAFT_396916 [Mycena amicta]